MTDVNINEPVPNEPSPAEGLRAEMPKPEPVKNFIFTVHAELNDEGFHGEVRTQHPAEDDDATEPVEEDSFVEINTSRDIAARIISGFRADSSKDSFLKGILTTAITLAKAGDLGLDAADELGGDDDVDIYFSYQREDGTRVAIADEAWDADEFRGTVEKNLASLTEAQRLSVLSMAARDLCFAGEESDEWVDILVYEAKWRRAVILQEH